MHIITLTIIIILSILLIILILRDMWIITSRECVYLYWTIVHVVLWMVMGMHRLKRYKTNRSRSSDANRRLRLWEKVTFDREQRNIASLLSRSPYRSRDLPTNTFILSWPFAGKGISDGFTNTTRIKAPGRQFSIPRSCTIIDITTISSRWR